MTIGEIVSAGAKSWGMTLPQESSGAFDRYGEMLFQTNQTMNLTAVDDPEGIARRHFLDSLRPLALGWLPQDACLVDVGTGAGFPGLPLAIARPDLSVTLADSLNKRTEFLKSVVEQLGLSDRVRVIWIRAEDMGREQQHREKYDFACARAVAALPTLAEYLLPLVRVDGAMLAWKGPGLTEELARGQRALDILGGGARQVDSYILGEQQLQLARIRKSRPTPPAYPRRAGKPGKQPL